MGRQAPRTELKNHFLKAQASTKFFDSELHTATLKNLEQELADQVKLNQRLELAIELKLKEAIDQLLGKKPVVSRLDLENVRFTDKICATDNLNQEI
jgi:hypothetical protein